MISCYLPWAVFIDCRNTCQKTKCFVRHPYTLWQYCISTLTTLTVTKMNTFHVLHYRLVAIDNFTYTAIKVEKKFIGLYDVRYGEFWLLRSHNHFIPLTLISLHSSLRQKLCIFQPVSSANVWGYSHGCNSGLLSMLIKLFGRVTCCIALTSSRVLFDIVIWSDNGNENCSPRTVSQTCDAFAYLWQFSFARKLQ